MEYCYIVPAGDELYHYGVKGMHWGIRRYQPYPDGKHGKFLKKRQAKKLIKAINKNEKVKGKREFYMRLSNEKSEELEKAGKYDKAAKQLRDAKEHARSIEEIRNLTKSYIKQLTDSGYNVDSKVKSSMRQAGRMMIDKYMLTGKNDNGKGKAHVQIQMMDNKHILNKQIQKDPKTRSLQDRFDDAYKKAESIHGGYGADSVNMSHPAVKWAIEEAVKKGGNRESVTRFIENEGEPPRHDNWAQVVLDYEKSKKKK